MSEKQCICTEDCMEGYNPNCTCECDECNCTELSEEDISTMTDAQLADYLASQEFNI